MSAINARDQVSDCFVIDMDALTMASFEKAFDIIEDANARVKVKGILDRLFASNIRSVTVGNSTDPEKPKEVKVFLNTARRMGIDLDGSTELFVPGEVHFEIHKDGSIRFEDYNYAPCDTLPLFRKYIWEEISFKEGNIVFICPHWVAEVLSGTPVVRTVPAEKALATLS